LVRSHPQLFRGGPILDVGANIGYTATLFAKAAPPEFKVYAFEPEPNNFAILGEMIKVSGSHERVVPIQAAVGQHDGDVELWRNPGSHADHRVLTSELRAGLPGRAPELFKVPLLNLDSFLARERIRPLPCFVKICVQGYELPVCRGLERTIDANPELSVALAYAPYAIKALGFDPDELVELFRSRGFSFYAIDERGGVRRVPAPVSDAVDLGRLEYLELLLTRRPLAL
jgi:FkbM family methyltransferase